MRRLFALAAVLLALSPSVEAAQGRLVLYTSQPNTDAQRTVDAFKRHNPDVEVQWVRDGTPKIIAKLQAELQSGQPQPDVLLIADVVTMEGLKRDGRLLANPEAKTDGIDPALYDRDHTYFSTKLITTGIAYNTRAPFKPESWQDLLKPEAKGLVAMPSPLASGAALIHTVALTQNLPQGWDYYAALAGNGAQALGGNGDVLKAVAGGDKLFGMIVDYMPIRERAKGAPIAFVFPREGVSAVTEPVAILKTARNVPAAKAFVDFLLSADGQAVAAGMGYIPARADVPLPPGYPPRASIKVLPFDPAQALAQQDETMQKFSDAMGE